MRNHAYQIWEIRASMQLKMSTSIIIIYEWLKTALVSQNRKHNIKFKWQWIKLHEMQRKSIIHLQYTKELLHKSAFHNKIENDGIQSRPKNDRIILLTWLETTWQISELVSFLPARFPRTWGKTSSAIDGFRSTISWHKLSPTKKYLLQKPLKTLWSSRCKKTCWITYAYLNIKCWDIKKTHQSRINSHTVGLYHLCDG